MGKKNTMNKKISKPGEYAGYSTPQFNGSKRYSQYVEVSDGTKLAVDYYIPTLDGVEGKGPFPVIWEFTPYERISYGVEEEYNIESYDFYNTEANCQLYTSHGYVFARADVRGKGASFGTRVAANSRTEAADGRDINEWLATQTWCTGKTGLIGSSYTGQTQLEIISMKPGHLKAACVGCTDVDHYDGWIRGGIARAFGANPDIEWEGRGGTVTIDEMVELIVPVDEDLDKNMLRKAIAQHVNNGLQIPFFKELLYRDSYSQTVGGEYWNMVSASRYLQDINDSGVAMYLLGGLYDVFRRDTLILHKNLTVPKKLTMGGWYHCFEKSYPRWNIEHLRWFDYWLKGIDNGIMDEGDFFMKTDHADEEFGFRNEWPVDKGSRDTYYLNNGALMKEQSQVECFDNYKAVYGITSGVEDTSINLMDAIFTGVPGKDIISQGLTYTTEQMMEDYTVIGHPMVNINFELETEGYDDIDFFVMISDYNPESGMAFPVSDGRLRASLRKTGTPHYDFLGLPWHPANKEDEEKIEPHKLYSLEIDMMPVSYVFKKGHQIKISIANSMKGFYYLGRPDYEKDPENYESPEIKIHIGGENGSSVTLPNIFNG